jgi:opacity protein-like surface antigen
MARAVQVWRIVLPLALLGVTGCATNSSRGVHLTPQLGAHRPGDQVYEVSGNDLEMENAMALGVTADAGFLRGTALYSSGARISSRGITGTDKIGDGSMLVLSGDAVWRPLPRVALQPYLLGGVGLKRFDYSIDDQGFSAMFDDHTDFAWHVGAGADLMLGNVGIMAEISDYIGSKNREFGRHDTFVTAGLRIRAF